MWSNVVSIDKKYDKELDFLLSKLTAAKNVSYAIEETKGRSFIYLASLCELQDQVEDELAGVLETAFLSFMKLRFILCRMPREELTFASVALICSLLHFDVDYEKNIVSKTLCDCLDYNIDGILTFRMSSLTDNWEELCSVAAHLVENSAGDDDMYDIATFITGTEENKSRLTISDNQIYNVSSRYAVEVLKLFDRDEFNFLSAVIGEHPGEIVVENSSLSAEMLTALKHIARVINK